MLKISAQEGYLQLKIVLQEVDRTPLQNVRDPLSLARRRPL
jgi:hypothetical protein